ncbi:MAG: hypothetical protein ACXVEE_29935 [Polyangiales bacterium]
MREPFELRMLGDGTERRYRRMRPEVEALPWGTLDPKEHDPRSVDAARKAWTLAAFQEHRTGAACAHTLDWLIAARAPVDLIATATRFPLDEMVHVEMCARVAMELGGGVGIEHDPTHLIPRPRSGMSALRTAADCVVRYFCVGEAISIPLLRGTWKAAKHPLLKGVLGRIVKDEAAHGQFGWTFLDWALEDLGEDDRAHLADVAKLTIRELEKTWSVIAKRRRLPASEVGALAWMETDAYLELAHRSLATKVLAPLRDRGIVV